jgi:hypothetical protein
LHSRPATINGKTRLHRWANAGAVAFTITPEWIAEQIDRVSDAAVRLNDLRPLHKHASFSSDGGASGDG